jgi:hypothetical protein
VSLDQNGSHSNNLSHSDITNARFAYDATWTYLVFVKSTDVATNDQVLGSKDAGQNRFHFRLSDNPTTAGIQCKQNNSWASTLSSAVAEDVWRMVYIKNDGDSGGNDLEYGVYETDGTLVTSTTETAHTSSNDTSGETGDIYVPGQSSSRYVRGLVARACYYKGEATTTELEDYAQDPDSQVTTWGSSNVEFYLKMDTSGSLGDDSSGNSNDFTVNGTPVYDSDEPVASAVANAIAGTLTTSGTLAKKTAKSFAGTLTTSGTLTKKVSKMLSGILSTSGTLAKKVFKSFSGTLSLSGTLAASLLYLNAIAGTLTTSGNLSRKTSKMLSGILSTSGALAKKTSKSWTGTVSFTGSLAKLLGKLHTGTLTTSGQWWEGFAASTFLTLRTRATSATLRARDIVQSLKNRVISFTLRNR